MSKVYGNSLLEEMAQHHSLPMSQLKQAANEILDVIRGGLIADGVVKISNFGTFRLKPVAERQGINPQTREPLTIPAHQRVVFTPCKALRELIYPIHQPPAPVSAPTEGDTSPQVDTTVVDEAPAEVERNEPTPDTTSDIAATEKVAEPVSQPVAQHAGTPNTPAPQAEPREDKPAEGVSSDAVEPLADDEPDAAESADKFSIDMGSLEALQPTRPSSRKRYLVAGAVIAVLLIPTLLLMEPPSPGKEEAVPTASRPEEARQSATLNNEAQNPGSKKETAVADESPTAETAPLVISQSPPPLSPPAPRVTTELIEREQPASQQETLEEPRALNEASTNNNEVFFQQQEHQLSLGENLWELAEEHYQDPLLWPHIYQANIQTIDNPNYLREGSTITLPTLQGRPGELSLNDRRKVAEGYYLTYQYYQKTGKEDAFFALLQAKHYDASVVEEARHGQLPLSLSERMQLAQQQSLSY